MKINGKDPVKFEYLELVFAVQKGLDNVVRRLQLFARHCLLSDSNRGMETLAAIGQINEEFGTNYLDRVEIKDYQTEAEISAYGDRTGKKFPEGEPVLYD